jgi:DNA repair photolyase
VEAVKQQLVREKITGQTIHLCFTCDPYPTGYDTTPTREIIKAIKASGNHVQILTKGDGSRDFDLLDENDWFGITLDGAITRTGHFDHAPLFRYCDLVKAHEKGIKTWVSFEPVLNAENVLGMIKDVVPHADKIKIGKLNYHPSDIDWKSFGREVECLCKRLEINYYIKDSLRAEMEKV